MINDICEVIAIHTPFSAAEICSVYDAYKSFDLVIAAAEYAINEGSSSLKYSAYIVNEKPKEL